MNSDLTKIAITGATGRMGKRLVALASEAACEVVAALVRESSVFLEKDAGDIAGVGWIGVPLTSTLDATPDVLIDFSSPDSALHWLDICVKRRIPMLLGTTGLTDRHHTAIAAAAHEVPIIQAANTSVGVNVLLDVLAEVSRKLGDDYDIEIVEAHHRGKKDAPSGTAEALANAILAATGKPRSALTYDRHGHDVPRQRGEIGMHSLRMGDEVGMHTVYFATAGERLEFTHRATTRDTFARGALRAAAWLRGRAAGRYSMADVLKNAK